VLLQAILGITALAAAEMASGAGSGAGPGMGASAPTAALSATALPTQATVAAGQMQISTSLTPGAAAANAVMNVNQSSNQGVVNWGSFNVGSNAQVNFNLPSASSSILNRVISSDPSQVLGSITSNGQVYLSNPNGVYFGRNASVDVGGLVATTSTITDSDYLAGLLNFNRNGSTAAVVNLGSLTANPGGYIALLAPEVRNKGVVFAQSGTIALATGEAISLSFDSATHLASISTTPATLRTLIDNKQAVLAPDGMIVLSAKALNSLVGGVIRNSGNLMADSLSSRGGTIVLEGGSIDIQAGSTVSAQGWGGGGTILLGGDWQGSGSLQRATSVNVDAGATLNASALDGGNGAGGKVVVYSDVSNSLSRTQMDGVILAKGAGSGAGGSVETSGHDLGVNGQVYTGGGLGCWTRVTSSSRPPAPVFRSAPSARLAMPPIHLPGLMQPPSGSM
jgi:filamentous hemagglutinin family protein